MKSKISNKTAPKRRKWHLKASTVMKIINYYQLDYEGVQLTGKLALLAPKPAPIVCKTIIPDKFKEDVDALCKYCGFTELASGVEITMSLREAVKLMPRKRQRIDSYKSLIKFLHDEMDVILIVKSQKIKK